MLPNFAKKGASTRCDDNKRAPMPKLLSFVNDGLVGFVQHKIPV